MRNEEASFGSDSGWEAGVEILGISARIGAVYTCPHATIEKSGLASASDAGWYPDPSKKTICLLQRRRFSEFRGRERIAGSRSTRLPGELVRRIRIRRCKFHVGDKHSRNSSWSSPLFESAERDCDVPGRRDGLGQRVPASQEPAPRVHEVATPRLTRLSGYLGGQVS